MHREIMQAPPGKVVDHINGNRLDNRKCNLRLCTRRQNLRNAAKRPGCQSQFKGVSFDRRHNRWFATIWFEGRSISLGSFLDEVEGARAYDRAALELFGEYAWLNFPDDWPPQMRKAVHAEAKATRRKLHAKPRRRKADRQKRKRSTPKVTKKRSVPRTPLPSTTKGTGASRQSCSRQPKN
jgi:hypothetical protein